jgi:drug/metabolite transporter (DMT)-like permease
VVATAALLFGSVVVLGSTGAVEVLPVATLLAMRFGIAGLFLAAVLLVMRRSLRPARGEAWRLVLLGAVGYALESSLFFLALQRGTAATVTLLFYTYPVLVAILAALTGQGVPGRLVLASLAAAVAGTAIVVASSGGLDITTLGIAFALGSALAFSIYLVMADRLVRRTSPLVTAMWISLSASLALVTAAVAGGVAEVPDADAAITVTAMGVLTAGAFFLLFLGLRRVGAVRSSVIASLEPVAAALLAAAFLGEPLRAGILVGGLLIVSGAIAATLARAGPQPERGVP